MSDVDVPRAAILSVGTELLLGDLADTNARWLSGRLSALGMRVVHHLAVGDDLDDLVVALRWLAARADLVVVGGGLGPTADDLTREAVAAAAGVELEHVAALEAALVERYRRRGRAMATQNLRQARVPAGAMILPAVGTAPGFALTVSGPPGARVIALPGVPWEMRELFDRHVVDEVRALGPPRATVTRRLWVAGLGESDVAALVEPTVDDHDEVDLSFLAHATSIEVRLTASAATPEEAAERAQPAVDLVRVALASYLVGVDDENLEQVVVRLLTERRETVAVAESATAGRICARLATVPGASAVLVAGAVVYATRSKHELLGVPEELLADDGPVSEAVTRELAARVRAVAETDWGIAVTGVAGPDAVGDLEPGTCFWAVADPHGDVEIHERWLPGDRGQVVTRLSTAALELLRRRLLDV